MLPWRPLGMLACGLTVIFLFIILHGNGYDFPVVIARCSDEIDYWTLPDKTYLEISGVHDFTQDVASAAVTNTKEESKHFLKRNKPAFMNQWHLGSKSTTQQEKADKSPNNEKMKRGAAAGKEGEKDDEEQWIWMTNIWHEISECGPAWELMYAHRFPGPIIHSSLSRRPLPKEADSKRDRESIRLAVVYKLVEEERVTYHSRVYHFGTFQRNGPELKEECQISVKETCHVHVPFLSFDYILPGSTPIKDFSLEHDTFLYSR
ncbi:hypothetical protein BX616_000305 [Lobosporangium transversale]|nr:hypothetical protein BX616_000305 [Lobosporangium transversale]